MLVDKCKAVGLPASGAASTLKDRLVTAWLSSSKAKAGEVCHLACQFFSVYCIIYIYISYNMLVLNVQCSAYFMCAGHPQRTKPSFSSKAME